MSFSALGLSDRILSNIPSTYTQPTPIQAQAIPTVLAGKDVLGLAQTGTGKTAAFFLPILDKVLKLPLGKTSALVLAPTRELVDQIVEEAQTWAKGTGIRVVGIYGGVNFLGQKKKLARGPEILVACPGRMLDHMAKRSLDYSHIEMLVLDEADQMFDMGFLPTVKRILSKLPDRRQNLLFSATMPKEIAHLAEEILNDPTRVEIETESAPDTIRHVVYNIAQNKKDALLLSLLPELGTKSILIFTRTKHRAKSLSAVLRQCGHEADDLQGNLSQSRRREVMNAFRAGECRLLVATDIAARGIDVSRISHVVNYDMPDTLEAYTHRTGRTGRARREGDALSFVSKGDEWFMRASARQLKLFPEVLDLPALKEEFLHVRQKVSQDERDEGRERTSSRRGSSSRDGFCGRGGDRFENEGQRESRGYGRSSRGGRGEDREESRPGRSNERRFSRGFGERNSRDSSFSRDGQRPERRSFRRDDSALKRNDREMSSVDRENGNREGASEGYNKYGSQNGGSNYRGRGFQKGNSSERKFSEHGPRRDFGQGRGGEGRSEHRGNKSWPRDQRDDSGMRFSNERSSQGGRQRDRQGGGAPNRGGPRRFSRNSRHSRGNAVR